MFPLIILLTVLLLGGYAWFASRQFDAAIKRELSRLFAETVKNKPVVVTEAMLQGLPEPIQRYLRYAGVVGKPIPQIVRLRQHGKFRTDPSRPWMEIKAEEYYSVNPPSFIWIVTAYQGGIPIIRGRDMYRAGRGQMNIKLGSVIDVVNAADEAIDQGAMMRYLSEIIGFPAAFLCDNICFEAIDGHAARVTLTDCGKSVTGTLFVDDEGRMTDFVALRYTEKNGKYELENWSTPVTRYGEYEGLRLPSAGAAVWKRKEGDFEYIDVDITELEYDVPKAY